MNAEVEAKLATVTFKFGPDSLAFVVPVEEHLSLLAEAGLAAACFWRYLAQAVVGGLKK